MDFAVYKLNQFDWWCFNSLRTIQISNPCFTIFLTEHFICFFAFHKKFALKFKPENVPVESNGAIYIRNG
mgnify:CR=1 FL=1